MTDDRPLVVLVVEDDRSIRRTVRAPLEAAGWQVVDADTIAIAHAEARARRFDLVIVDLGLPDGDGVDLIAEIRGRSRVPIIVLSARSEEEQKVRALDAGADDYIEKPFRIAEFLARVRAHLRRHPAAENGGGDGSTTIGDVEFDAGARLVRKAGQEVHLTALQYKLFAFMMANADRVLTHRQLLREVWGPDRVEHSHYLRVFMAQLRHKLEDDPTQPALIVTETGVGYRLISGS